MKLFVVAAVLGVAAAGRLDNTYLPPRGGGGFGGQGGSAGGFGQSGSVGFGAKSSGFNSGSYGQSAGGFNQGSGAFNQGGGGAFGHASGGFNQGVQAHHAGNAYNAPAQTYNARPQASIEAGAQILKYDSDVTADGFSYDFETSNGIRADAHGVATNGVQSQGSFAYKGDDGQDYSITYTADENGYRPQGAHLPTPPPIPEAILKSLEQNARDEAAGINDDGQYRGEGAGHGGAGHGGAGGYGGGAGFGQGSGQFSQSSGQFGKSSGQFGQSSGQFGGSSGGFLAKSAQGAGSTRYLPPNAGPARNSGSFNQNTGYQY